MYIYITFYKPEFQKLLVSPLTNRIESICFKAYRFETRSFFFSINHETIQLLFFFNLVLYHKEMSKGKHNQMDKFFIQNKWSQKIHSRHFKNRILKGTSHLRKTLFNQQRWLFKYFRNVQERHLIKMNYNSLIE